MPDIRFRLIDESNIEDHYRLESGDQCLYLFEYTSRKNYSFSDTNNLISNLKKKPSASQMPGYGYKQRAIDQCAIQVRRSLPGDWLAKATLVPVPSSKAVGHPDYDDRVERICRGVGQHVDVRRLVRQIKSMDAAHESAHRPTVQDLISNYEIDESLAAPAPIAIGVVDDMLTAGTHFKAMQHVLSTRFPDADIFGLFVARRIFPDDEPLALDD